MARHNNDIRKIRQALRPAIDREISDFALKLDGDLKEVTPVDTGWAANNWTLSTGRAYRGGTGEPGDPNTALARSEQGIAAVASYALSDGIIYLVNNVPYIDRLNDGSSNQAPQMFIELTVQKNVAEFNSPGRVIDL